MVAHDRVRPMAPIFASLAVILPAVLAAMDFDLLWRSRHKPIGTRRVLRRRALSLTTLSALALYIFLNLLDR